MNVVVAVILGLVILLVGFATLRGLAGPRGGAPPAEEDAAVPEGMRILWWCENCGAEVLVLRRGADTPLRHCGEAMVRREEIARDNGSTR